MNAPVDVSGILERAGADADAAEGTQAWALAQVDGAVAELIEVAASALYDLREVRDRCTSLVAVGLDEQVGETIDRLGAALARVGGVE